MNIFVKILFFCNAVVGSLGAFFCLLFVSHGESTAFQFALKLLFIRVQTVFLT